MYGWYVIYEAESALCNINKYHLQLDYKKYWLATKFIMVRQYADHLCGSSGMIFTAKLWRLINFSLNFLPVGMFLKMTLWELLMAMGLLLQVHYQTGSMITSGVHVTSAPFKCDTYVYAPTKKYVGQEISSTQQHLYY